MGFAAHIGWTCLAALAAPAAIAQASLSTSSEYSVGAYGEATDTSLIYTAVSAGHAGDDWSIDATLPWVELDGPATFLGADAPLGRSRGTRAQGETISGLADIALSLTRTFNLSSDAATRLDLTGRVQLPTADKDKGLGTGETRYSLGLDLSRDIGAFTLFAGGGWRSGGEDFEDAAFASTGLAWLGDNGFSLGAAWDYSEASTAGVEAASEASAWISIPASKSTRIHLYAVAGFSEGSPEQALGARLVFGG